MKSQNNETVKKKFNWYPLALGVLVAVFALVILLGMGDFSMPDSSYRFAPTAEEGSGKAIAEEMVVKLELNKDSNGEEVQMDSVWVHTGALNIPKKETATVTFKYATSNVDSGSWNAQRMGEVKFSDDSGSEFYGMYKWRQLFKDLTVSKSYKYIRIVTEYDLEFNELVFADKNGDVIKASVVEANDMDNAVRLFDEQDKFSTVNDKFNSIIFDEYYFARSARDFLNGDAPFIEYSHPPLGKALLAVGIGIFGMNTFGMRIMPALFSIALIPVLYLFGKKLFKSKGLGLLFAALFAISGLNFAESRIGTTDMMLVFFVVLAYYFMYDFYARGINLKHKFSSVLPMVLSGIFFGLACSVKWSGVYAGIGLFAIFVIILVKQYKLYKKNRAAAEGGETAIAKAKSDYKTAALAAVISAGVSFVLIAFFLYMLSYMIVGASYCTLYDTKNIFKAFWENQKYIMNFHTSEMSADGSTSPWWGWLLNIRSACFYKGDSVYGEGMYARIHSMGNMSMFILAFASGLYLLIQVLMTKFSKNASEKDKQVLAAIKTPFLILGIGFLANYLCWMFISRPLYIYAFLPSSVFYVGFIVLMIKALTMQADRHLFTIAKVNIKVNVGMLISAIAVAVMFINFWMFYPAFAGIAISDTAAKVLFSWANLWPSVFLKP